MRFAYIHFISEEIFGGGGGNAAAFVWYGTYAAAARYIKTENIPQAIRIAVQEWSKIKKA